MALALILVATAAAYSASIRGEFQFDDETSVVENVAIRDLGAYLRERLVPGYVEAMRPITEVTFAVDYALGGLGVLAYHATNVLLHLAAVLLVWALTRRTLRRLEWPGPDALALWVAALFALHPIQSQAVSYVCQRAEILASIFYLVALMLLLEAEEHTGTRRGKHAAAGALFAFILGLGSKAIIVTLPAAFLLYGAAFPRRTAPARPSAHPWRARLLLAAPFFALSTLFAALQFRALGAARGVGFDLPSLGPGRYCLTQLRVLLSYLGLIAWPAGQNLDPEVRVSDGLLEPATLAAAAAIAGLLASAAWCWRSSRAAAERGRGAKAARLWAFGLLWFLLLLTPTSSVIPVKDVMEEHRVYLASWGVLLAGAAAASALWRRLGAARLRAPAVSFALATVPVLVLGVALHERNAVWASRVSLWRDVVSKSPTKARAHENLGHALHRAGDERGADAEYLAALRLGGDGSVPLAKLQNNVAASLMEAGRLEEAARFLENALAVSPGDALLLNNLAMTRLWRGELDAALVVARRSVALHPGDPGSHSALGRILSRRGDEAAAAREYAIEAALDLDAARRLRSAALERERRGDVTGACAAWARVLAMRPGALQEREASAHLATLGCR